MPAAPEPPQRETEMLTSVASVGRSVALTVLAVLAVFYTLYFAATLFVPIAAAVLLSMLLAPPVQFLERLHVPRLAASAFVVLATVGCIGAGFVEMTRSDNAVAFDFRDAHKLATAIVDATN